MLKSEAEDIIQDLKENFSFKKYTNILYTSPTVKNIFRPFEKPNYFHMKGKPLNCNYFRELIKPEIKINDNKLKIYGQIKLNHEEKLNSKEWLKKKRNFQKEREFIEKYKDKEFIDINLSEKVNLKDVYICSKCGEVIPIKIGKCTDHPESNQEQAKINKNIRLNAKFELENKSFKNIKQKISNNLYGDTGFSTEKALRLILLDEKLDIEHKNILIQSYQSDNYGVPSTVYNSFRLIYEINKNEANNNKDIIKSFDYLNKEYNIHIKNAKIKNYKDSSFLVIKSSAISSEKRMYNKFWSTVKEMQKSKYKNKSILILNEENFPNLSEKAFTKNVNFNNNLFKHSNELSQTISFNDLKFYPRILN